MEILTRAGGVVDKVETHATALAFAWQVIEKDVNFSLNSGKWNGKPPTFIVQDLINMYSGRILGLKPFPAVSNYPKTFQFNNIFNPLTSIGILLWLSHQVGFTSSRVGRVGGKLAIGAAIGSIFDDPLPMMSSSPYVGMITGTGQLGMAQSTPVWQGGV